MTNPTDDQKNRAAAKEFLGWKEGQMCTGCRVMMTIHADPALDIHHPHSVPPPDLLQPANAWALQRAMRAKGYDVEWITSGVEIWKRWIENDEAYSKIQVHIIITDTEEAALRDAAFALTEEGRG